MSWFRSAKSSISPGSIASGSIASAEISTGPAPRSVAAPPTAEPEIAEPEIADLKLAEPEIDGPEIAKLETVKPARPADVVPRESPKAVFDNVARSGEKFPRDRTGFTVHASKNGETNETQRTSPTITVAKARILFKSGWRVHIADAAGREYGPGEFDEILKFDRH
jgi:hypothetical protein